MNPWQRITAHPAFPYCAPGAVWAAFSLLDRLHPLAVYLLYPIQVFAVLLVAAFQWRRWPSLDPERPWLSVAVGLFGAAAWLALLPLFPAPTRPLFDPAHVFGPGQLAFGLTVFRVFGQGLLVPVIEAVFVYGFFIRFRCGPNSTKSRSAPSCPARCRGRSSSWSPATPPIGPARWKWRSSSPDGFFSPAASAAS